MKCLLHPVWNRVYFHSFIVHHFKFAVHAHTIKHDLTINAAVFFFIIQTMIIIIEISFKVHVQSKWNWKYKERHRRRNDKLNKKNKIYVYMRLNGFLLVVALAHIVFSALMSVFVF